MSKVYRALYDEALSAGRVALHRWAKTNPDNPRIKHKGFLNIKIVDRSSEFSRWCLREQKGIRDRENYVIIVNPVGFTGRNNVLYRAIGEAFASVLIEGGVDCEVLTRVLPP